MTVAHQDGRGGDHLAGDGTAICELLIFLIYFEVQFSQIEFNFQ